MNISPMEALGRAHLRDVLTETIGAIEAVYEGADLSLLDEFSSEADLNDARLGESLEALRGLLEALRAAGRRCRMRHTVPLWAYLPTLAAGWAVFLLLKAVMP